MSDCRNCAGPAKNFVILRSHIAVANKKHLLLGVPPELILAIGVKESNGNMFFDRKDLLFRENMVVAMRNTGFTEAEVLKVVCIDGGPLSGKISKFRFEPSWKDAASTYIDECTANSDWHKILCMSFGYFQKGMVWHLGAKARDQWKSAFALFKASPEEQIKVVANDMRILLKKSNGNAPLALTRYNAGGSAEHISDYGNKVFSLYTEFLKER